MAVRRNGPFLAFLVITERYTGILPPIVRAGPSDKMATYRLMTHDDAEKVHWRRGGTSEPAQEVR